MSWCGADFLNYLFLDFYFKLPSLPSSGLLIYFHKDSKWSPVKHTWVMTQARKEAKAKTRLWCWIFGCWTHTPGNSFAHWFLWLLGRKWLRLSLRGPQTLGTIQRLALSMFIIGHSLLESYTKYLLNWLDWIDPNVLRTRRYFSGKYFMNFCCLLTANKWTKINDVTTIKVKNQAAHILAIFCLLKIHFPF